MKKYIIISLLFGFALGYVTFITLDAYSNKNHTVAIQHSPHAMHLHEPVPVLSENIPSISANIFPDHKSGYNINLVTEHFEFTPELANMENVQNQGHAHIYVNNEKVARVYGSWYHLDNHYLVDGSNTIRISLNANDHSVWSINNNPIEVSYLLD
ncbi:MAG: hypothetical protein MRY57_03480 [Candidatus Pacebacteria bacterium]|nr:hypothetical protein [Candidatus Paceibacterota bacterium]